MVETALNKLLDEFKVDNDLRGEFKDEYRLPLQDVINTAFDLKPNYRYGGSLAKGTANSNSCDIDLLCYLDSECGLSIENIYKTVSYALSKSNYVHVCKNSAICVTGERYETPWDISVDVVPGKYTSNDENKDVFLWCDKDKQRLKSNPEIQINIVKQSNVKDVVRLIKLFRSFHNFNFKSFFLEIFAIEVVESEIKNNDTIYDKLVRFCSHYNDIGKKKINDPANSNNNIMGIHTDYEFNIIREKIKSLYEILLTNDEISIINYLKGKSVDIDLAYAKDAKSHSPSLLLHNTLFIINLECKDSCGNNIYSERKVKKGIDIIFHIKVPKAIPVKHAKLIVSNAGYEAINCPRGNEETTTRINGQHFTKDETTSYNGNHYVQAIVYTSTGNKYYSRPFIVKIRDYE